MVTHARVTRVGQLHPNRNLPQFRHGIGWDDSSNLVKLNLEEPQRLLRKLRVLQQLLMDTNGPAFDGTDFVTFNRIVRGHPTGEAKRDCSDQQLALAYQEESQAERVHLKRAQRDESPSAGQDDPLRAPHASAKMARRLEAII